MSGGILTRKSVSYGTLRARFVLDDKGQPQFSLIGKKHYFIDLIFESTPNVSIESVFFELDETTYSDPVRLARSTDNRSFTSRIMSYGDYNVLAKVETGNEFLTVSGMLSELLRRGHGPEVSSNPLVADALSEITNN